MRALACLVVGLVATSCASTEMSTYVDPAYRSGSRFASVIILGTGMALDERQMVEEVAVRAFQSHGVLALRGTEVLPPTRQYTDKEVVNAIVRTGVETVLVLGAGAKDVSETYVPPSYHPGTTYGTANTYGSTYGNTYSGTTTFNVYQTPGYTTGGYTLSKPRANYSAILLEVKSGNAVWKADAFSRGNAFASFDDLAVSVAEESVKQLLDDGLF